MEAVSTDTLTVTKRVLGMSEQTKLIINVSTHMDGYGFRLQPKSQVWLEEHYAIGETVSSVFIGFDKTGGIKSIPPKIWNQVCQLLTGFTLEEMNKLGGFQAVFLPTKDVTVDSLELHV